jgi:hypothetical protein
MSRLGCMLRSALDVERSAFAAQQRMLSEFRRDARFSFPTPLPLLRSDSFGAQRNHRLDATSAARRDPAGEKRDA